MNSTNRNSFRLSGPSIKLDERTHAVRGDLADISLADKIFVPHYARPMAMVCIDNDAAISSSSDAEGEQIATLAAGDTFMVVDMAGGWAWGFRADDHLVGFVALSALEQAK